MSLFACATSIFLFHSAISSDNADEVSIEKYDRLAVRDIAGIIPDTEITGPEVVYVIRGMGERQ